MATLALVAERLARLTLSLSPVFDLRAEGEDDGAAKDVRPYEEVEDDADGEDEEGGIRC